ncbi:MAG: hypothetical protein J7K54_03120 [Candidatus Aenigmarchaeota archaeon]|nr:hypothetical protein [Candidatus Aenigmarchaeota archaeon]
MVRFFILDVQQSGPGKSEVMLWGKTEKGEPVLVIDRSFRPYFFVEYREGMSRQEVDDLKKRLSSLSLEGRMPEKVEEEERTLFGTEKRLLRINVSTPSDVIRFRDAVKEWKDVKAKYEHSITFYRRYLIDRDVRPLRWAVAEGREETGGEYPVVYADSIAPDAGEEYPKLSLMALDIELVEEEGEERIIMVSLKDNKGFRKVISWKKADIDYLEVVRDEKELIQMLQDVVRSRNPDIIATYNGDSFDMKILNQRAAKHGIELALGRTGRNILFKRRGRVYAAWLEGRVHIDLFRFVYNILSDTLSSDSLTLDSVSRELIGRGKRRMEWDELQKAWEESKGIERIIKYCMTDSELALSLVKLLLPQMIEMCRVVNQGLFDTSRMTYSQLVEWLLMKESRKTTELIPNRPKYEVIQIRRRAAPYTGGYVYPPKSGIHRNIALFDFMSLYPSITITHNVSPETLYCHCCKDKDKKSVHRVPGLDYYYCRKHEGFVSGVLKRVVKMRKEIRKRMEGMDRDSEEYRMLDSRQYALKILANASYGYYGYAGSRWYSRVCAQSITAWGRYYIQKVIRKAEKLGYEVIYGDTDSLFVKVKSRKDALRILDEFNNSLPGSMELDFQGLYKAGIFVPAKTGLAAKKRYALVDDTGEMTIRGFEIVRRDWSPVARETQEKILSAILKDGSGDEALEIARKTVGRISKGRIDIKKMVIHTQLTRPLKAYEQVGPHVVAARKAAGRGRPIAQGSMISYVITPGKGSISERAEPAEDAQEYDPEYYINNQVVPAALRVLSALGYTEEDITESEDSQASLQSFMKKSIRDRIKRGMKAGR